MINERQKEHLLRLHNSQRGVHISEEHKRKISLGKLGKPNYKGRKPHEKVSEKQQLHMLWLNNLKKGVHITEEHKKNISGAKKGVPNLKKRIPREIRYCLCGCGFSKEVKVNSTWRYKSGHNARGKIRSIKEIRTCICGCAQTFECKMLSSRKYFGKSCASRGRKHTEETKQKMSLAQKVNAKKNPKKFSGKNNPMYGKSPGHGKWFDFFNPDQGWLRLRSSYELVLAKYLIARKIRFLYESKRFILDNKTYLPDFYIVDKDKFIEVKGWKSDSFKQKWGEMKRMHPDVDIELWDSRYIDALKEEVV